MADLTKLVKPTAYTAVAVSSLWIAEIFLNTHLSLANSYISELSVAGQPHYLIFHSLDIIGSALFLLSFAMMFSLSKTGFQKKLTLILLVCGLALFVNSLFPMDCSPSQSLQCFNREVNWDISTSQYIHIIGAIIAFGGLVFAQAYSAYHYFKKSSNDFVWHSINLGAQLVLNGGVIYICLSGGSSSVGIFQRLSILAMEVWLIVYINKLYFHEQHTNKITATIANK